MRKTLFSLLLLCILLPSIAWAFEDTGNQEGRFIGQLILYPSEMLTKYGEWWYDEIHIYEDATLNITAYDGEEAKGKIVLRANKIQIDGTIDAKEKGHRGYDGLQVHSNGGYRGSPGYNCNGQNGENGQDANDGINGEGPFGGKGGVGGKGGNGGKGANAKSLIGGSGGSGGSSSGFSHGEDGGYLGSGTNGDESIDISVFMGSAGGAGGRGAGGGGGGGGAGYNYILGGYGGNGGAGGKGGEEGSGGAYIKIFANNYIHIKGLLTSKGEAGIPGQQGENGKDGGKSCDLGCGGAGGKAQENGGNGQSGSTGVSISGAGGGGGGGGNGSNGGNGAGGGILLYCPSMDGIILAGDTNIDARGGGNSLANGGTVKCFYQGIPPNSNYVESGRYFSAKSNLRPLIPELTTPVDAFTTYQAEIDLRAVYQSPDLYKGKIYLQLATDNNFNNIVFDTLSTTLVASGTEVEIRTSKLSTGSYYWRAQNIDSLGLGSDHSEVRSFKVLEGVPPTLIYTVTLTSTSIPTPAPEIQIRSYPSRINPEKGEYARIRWCQDESCPATIKLYNLHGELVKTLADNIFFSRGQEHEVSWRGINAADKTVGSGIYIVHIKAGEYQDKAKICVVK